ncbi:similar to Saccharomyces cerevisiae YAR002W NUP60 Subunit of the nuclear pore complex (NPC) [Maudiozyma saulgeensis]|uniref:Similar to Saccharomyces cerevisiae YAR002W NUP60 Subunit of the nuclear pore complex (NPC) n=1 Tax=Maudiozyma saulgeensis TaxID=1789683 RepID=A0A1X7RAD1_9SACH|nr:similar to Saccharomyces cerevisiae YAR002W NUP60 Subunit of the nuclear pore complex (NPC) [Kazachstania saulgeensis]
MTRMSNGKSYREQAAPYRRPISTRTNEKMSMFGRIKKSLFGGNASNNNNNNNKDESLKPRGSTTGNKRVMSSSSIPGGFFNADASNISIVPQPSENNITMNDTNLADISVSSNAKLASFFASKGDAPLSEMEMEGVMSLMKKANTTIKEDDNDNESVINGTMASSHYGGNDTDINVKNGRSTVLRGKNLGSVNNSFKMPSFTPKYDHSTMTLDRHHRKTTNNSNNTMQRNSSFASTASSTRRVFDYNRLPSPYKTVVFRYKSMNGDETKRSLLSTNEKKTIKIDKPKKGVSNTASALLSLLDGNQSESMDNDTNNTSLANPYSTLVPRIRKKPVQMQVPVTIEPTEPSIINSKKESVLPISSEVETIEKTTKPVTDAPIELPKRNKPEPIVNVTTTATTNNTVPSEHPFKLYKPTRSSSLRSSVVAANGNNSTTETKESSSLSSTQATIPSFTFKKPEPQKELKKIEVELNPVTEKVPFTPSTSLPQPNIFNNNTNNNNNKSSDTPTVPQYEFNISLPSSDIDPSTVDEKQVEQFKSLFAF